ncbi:MAG: polysaccharide deacetylase family protein [Aquisalimonadaceae bacterium]
MVNLSRFIRAIGPLGFYAAARGLTRRHPRILMYHRFSAEPRRGFVSRETLARQLEMIRRHFRPVSLSTLIETLRAGETPAPNTIVVTVDDGYRDFHDVAWPVLREYDVPATLFVTTGFVDDALWLWPDQVAWLLAGTEPLPDTLSAGDIHLRRDQFGHWNRNTAWQALINHLLALPDAEKHAAVESLAASLDAALPASAPADYAAVTWDQLRAMQAEGLDVGGHTHTHPTLPRVPVENLPAEIDYCRERLDAGLGMRPRPFCYPNGQPSDFSQVVRDRVEQAGFTGAVVAFADGATHNDLYALRRHASAEGEFQYYKALNGVEWLGRRLRRTVAATA